MPLTSPIIVGLATLALGQVEPQLVAILQESPSAESLRRYHWFWGVLFTIVFAIVIWILIARRIGKRLQPAMEQVQRQMQQQHFQFAYQSLEDMLPMCKWIPLLKGQLLAQMGMLSLHMGEKDRGIQLLEGASLRNADARLMLACLRWRDDEKDRAIQVLELTSKIDKKHPLLHNTFAWMLHKQGKNDRRRQLSRRS